MKRLLILALTLFVLLAVNACKKDQEAADQAPVTVLDTSVQIFDFVPADTPYLFGNLDMIPDETLDFFLTKMQPLLDQAQGAISKSLENAKAEPAAGETEEAAADEENSDYAAFEGHKLVYSWLQELDGKLNRDGIEELGFKIPAHQIVYGIGPFPVMRLEIGDGEAMRNMVRRVMERAEMSLQDQQFGDQNYWQVAMDKINLLVSVQDYELAFALVPPGLNDAVLPNLLGSEQPADALDAVAALTQLNSENAYLPYGSGYLDVARFVQIMTDDPTPAASAFRSLAELDFSTMEPECRAEFNGFAQILTRLKTGYTELDTSSMAMAFSANLESQLASDLAGLTAANSVFSSDPGGAISMAFGINIPKVREWLLAKAEQHVAAPYKCSSLADLNQQWQTMQTQLNRPLPPFVGNLTGIRLRLDDLDMQGTMPSSGKGLVALTTSNPEMLIGMAQMFLPNLASLELEPNGEPQPLPLDGMPVPVDQAFIAMNKDSIGIAMGEDMAGELGNFIENTGGSDGAVLAFGYDFAFYFDKIKSMMPDLSNIEGVNQEELAMHQELMTLYGDFLDRQFSVIRLTDKGIEAEQSISFQ